jgi:hypothetical protein
MGRTFYNLVSARDTRRPCAFEGKTTFRIGKPAIQFGIQRFRRGKKFGLEAEGKEGKAF